MKIHIATAFSFALFAASAAQAAGMKTTCARGADARVIEIISPGVIGESCDVRYTRGQGANVSVPYHADNSDTFCNKKAADMVQRLTMSGFTCNTTAPALRADASPGGSDYVVESQRAAAPQKTVAANEAVADRAGQEPMQTPLQHDADPVVAQSDEPVETNAALEDEMSRILAQPVLQTAPGEPAQLIAHRTARSPSRPQPSPVGRIVGAPPSEPQAAMPVTQASLTAPETAAVASSQALTTAPPAAAAPVETKATPQPVLRTPSDVVRAALMAQAAAWNEGDLDGFMNGYWKSDDLKFVSGGVITKGWDATLKRYRERYAAGGGLGQLGLEKLDIKLVTDNVAVVTGRFNLNNNNENSSGLFSLVMRRDNGAWRIVHDHSSEDAKAAQ